MKYIIRYPFYLLVISVACVFISINIIVMYTIFALWNFELNPKCIYNETLDEKITVKHRIIIAYKDLKIA